MPPGLIAADATKVSFADTSHLGRRTVRLLRFRRLCSKTYTSRVDDFERVTTTLSAHAGLDVEGQCVSRRNV